ncbi:hypothetical protein [Streptomyces monashensis]|uniref:hypothetical protein n=1 Tax=Streptomyces monashensis TaxID=1678012 RepID=UPI0015A6B4B3|nr:hypothetical protein [Streptomyces monashensis]
MIEAAARSVSAALPLKYAEIVTPASRSARTTQALPAVRPKGDGRLAEGAGHTCAGVAPDDVEAGDAGRELGGAVVRDPHHVGAERAAERGAQPERAGDLGTQEVPEGGTAAAGRDLPEQ